MDENFFASDFIVRKIKLFSTRNEILIFHQLVIFVAIYEDDEMMVSVSWKGRLICGWCHRLWLSLKTLSMVTKHIFLISIWYIFHPISFIKNCMCSGNMLQHPLRNYFRSNKFEWKIIPRKKAKKDSCAKQCNYGILGPFSLHAKVLMGLNKRSESLAQKT